MKSILRRGGVKAGAMLSLALVMCVPIACGESRTQRRSSDRTAVSAPVPSQPVAAVHGRLLGDEDDDDEPGGSRGAEAHSAGDSDADFDNDSKALQNKTYHDRDDPSTSTWGPAASAADRRAVTALLVRYYQLAAAGDGSDACKLISVLFAEAIPEDYGQPPGPPQTRGKTCAEVMTKLFALERAKLAAASATIRVTGVRVEGRKGRALVGFATVPASYINLQKERDGAWRVVGTLAVPLS